MFVDRLAVRNRAPFVGPKEKWLGVIGVRVIEGRCRFQESDNITVGLNWYLNRNIRLMFNFVNVDGKREGDLESDDPKIVQWRFQLAF